MKKADDTDEPTFQVEGERATRAAQVIFLAGVIFGLVAIVAGMATGEGVETALGLLGFGIAGLSRRWLQTRPDRQAVREAAEARRADGGVSDEEDFDHFIELLREWDALERQRGSSDFDPWAVQAARRDIREAVAENPALERLFQP